jgi:heme/copper-type cytochrome/quinol oxidase subunit 1
MCGDKSLALRKIPRLGFAAACLGYLLVFISLAVGGFAGWQWYQEFAAANMQWTFGPWSVLALVGVTWLIGGFLLTISRRIIHCQRCRAAFDAW